MKIVNLCVILWVIFLFSCSTSGREGVILHNDNLRIVNIDEIPKEGFLKASSVFKRVKPIILETTDESLIGHIGGVYVFDDFIVIFDNSPQKAILVFDSKGKFVRKIGKLGAGPEEYLNISDFTVDSENREIYIMDQSASKINKYNILSGEFVNSIEVKRGRFPRHVQYVSNSLFVDANLKTDEQKLIYQIDTENGQEISSWLNADSYNAGWMETLTFGYSFFFSKNTDHPKYVNLFMDTIMSIVDDKLIPTLVVKSDRWVTLEELKTAYTESGIEGYQKMMKDNRVFGITQLIECGEYVFFTIWDGKEEFSVYNSKDEARVFKLFGDDLVYTDDRFPINNMQFSDSKGIYAYTYPQLFAFSVGVDLKDILNPKIDRYDELIKLPEDANPVLFYYELK